MGLYCLPRFNQVGQAALKVNEPLDQPVPMFLTTSMDDHSAITAYLTFRLVHKLVQCYRRDGTGWADKSFICLTYCLLVKSIWNLGVQVGRRCILAVIIVYNG